MAQKNYPPDGSVIAHSIRPRDLAAFIDPQHQAFSISKQAELIGLARSSYYYQPVVNETAEARLKAELNAVDAIYTKYPFYGTRRILIELERNHDIHIGRERVRRLMGKLGLQAIYPKPNTSKTTPCQPPQILNTLFLLNVLIGA